MQFDIVKCHGSGNDFVLIDGRALTLRDGDWASVARAVADRAGPIGSDGLLVLGHGRGDSPFAMMMRNSDGSESGQCLNGLRCVARLGFERLGIDAAEVTLRDGSVAAARGEPLAPGVYTVVETAGPVSLDARRWLVADGDEWIDRVIPGLPSSRAFTAVDIGNPHLIAFVERVDDDELAALGRFAEATPPLLPERANVSFVEARGGDGLFVRTCERGVGLTDSCGSAMAAATFAACRTGRAGFDAALTVHNRGGRVVASASADGRVTIRGNATWEWAGSVTVDLANARVVALDIAERYADEVAAWATLAADDRG